MALSGALRQALFLRNPPAPAVPLRGLGCNAGHRSTICVLGSQRWPSIWQPSPRAGWLVSYRPLAKRGIAKRGASPPGLRPLVLAP